MTRNLPIRRGTVGLVLVLALALAVTGCGSKTSQGAKAPQATVTPTVPVVSFSTAAASATPLPVTPTFTPELLPTPTYTPAPTPTPTFPARPENENPLTGLAVDDPAVLQRRPLHVRIGNDPIARPQVGLSLADLVYEEIVEWGVTRYTAIFLSQSPEMIAPIRSARLINTQLTGQYNAALVNSGGSDGVRWELSQLPIVNLDEYFWPQPYYYRENEGWATRLAVDAIAVHQLMEREDMQAAAPLRGFTFSDEPVGGDPAQHVHIPYPQKTSPVDWHYDAPSGRYLRWVSDRPMTDFVDNAQISAANVIIYYAEHQETDIVEDSRGATSIRIIVNGQGRAQIIRDGVVIEGLWRTDGGQTPEFVFANDVPIPLKRGNSWIEVVPVDYEVTIEP